MRMRERTILNQNPLFSLRGRLYSPREKSTCLEATATADPLDDPPGMCAEAAGLVGVS